jgi:hypothetical protein
MGYERIKKESEFHLRESTAFAHEMQKMEAEITSLKADVQRWADAGGHAECKDRIQSLEQSYTDAQAEIARLKETPDIVEKRRIAYACGWSEAIHQAANAAKDSCGYCGHRMEVNILALLKPSE